jgi:hypothetical protein
MAQQLLDPGSGLASSTALDLFSLPLTQCVIESSYWTENFPKNPVGEASAPIDFVLDNDLDLLDMSTSYLHIAFSVTKADGSAIDRATDDASLRVAPVNYTGCSLFRQIKVYMSNRLVYDSDDLYAYRCYMDSTLNCSTQLKDTVLQCAGYYRDESGKFDSIDNAGFRARGNMVNGGAVSDFLVPLHADCFSHDKLLPNGLQIRLELHRSSDAFVLQSPGSTEFKAKIHNISWLVRKVQVLPSMTLALENQLSKQPARYAIRRTTLKTIHVEPGRRKVHEVLLTSGQVPRRVVLCATSNAAFHGSFELSPFNFQHFNICKAQLQVCSMPIPRNGLEMNFSTKHYSRAYLSTLDALNFSNLAQENAVGNGISYQDFSGGYMFLVFETTGDQSDGWHLIRSGNTTLTLDFGAETPAGGIKLIAYLEYENCMFLSKHRVPYFDYSQ